MKCKICGAQTQEIFKTLVLLRYHVTYYHCQVCDFVHTEDPYWLAEAYCNPISHTDTGILARNITLTRIVAVLIYFLYNKQSAFVDYAGGYGIFTRLMRDIGFDYYWYDPYAHNMLAPGFSYVPEKKTVSLVTAFECFEHFTDPLKETATMLSIASHIIFTTDFIPDPIPLPHAWWYYACDQGQHISFYRQRTFDYIAQQYGLKFYSHWGIHLLTSKDINPRYFRMLIEWCNRGLFSIVKRNMKSRTVDDRTICMREKNTLGAS
jgi:hypothetical protein